MFREDVEKLAEQVMRTPSSQVKDLMLEKISYIAMSAVMDLSYRCEVDDVASKYATMRDGLDVPDQEHKW